MRRVAEGKAGLYLQVGLRMWRKARHPTSKEKEAVLLLRWGIIAKKIRKIRTARC